MIDWIISSVCILTLVIWGVCFISVWISGFRMLAKYAKGREKLDCMSVYPEPLATADAMVVCNTLEMLSDSFDVFDCGFGGDC